MPVDSSANILTLSNTQAKDLAGRIVIIGGAMYCAGSRNFLGLRPRSSATAPPLQK